MRRHALATKGPSTLLRINLILLIAFALGMFAISLIVTATLLALVRRLEASGISVWIAPRDVSPATDWAAEIIDAISSARLMVLVFSGSSNDSGQVRREVERAVHKQVPILPFRIEDVLPSKSLEYFLST